MCSMWIGGLICSVLPPTESFELCAETADQSSGLSQLGAERLHITCQLVAVFLSFEHRSTANFTEELRPPLDIGKTATASQWLKRMSQNISPVKFSSLLQYRCFRNAQRASDVQSSVDLDSADYVLMCGSKTGKGTFAQQVYNAERKTYGIFLLAEQTK